MIISHVKYLHDDHCVDDRNTVVSLPKAYCIGTICSPGRERFGEINVERVQHTDVF